MPTKAPERRPVRKAAVPRQPTLTDVNERTEDDDINELTVDGQRVVESTRMQNLPNVPMNLVRLTLEDGTRRYQCVDCPTVIGTRDEIRAHRKHVHTEPGKVTSLVMSLSVGQLIELAESNVGVGNLLARVEAERDRYRNDFNDLKRKYDALVRRLDRAGLSLKEEEK